MDDRDQELEEILGPLRQIAPSEKYVDEWYQVVLYRIKGRKRQISLLAAIVASLAMGFSLGLFYSRMGPSLENVDKRNFANAATKVESFINID